MSKYGISKQPILSRVYAARREALERSTPPGTVCPPPAPKPHLRLHVYLHRGVFATFEHETLHFSMLQIVPGARGFETVIELCGQYPEYLPGWAWALVKSKL